MNAFDFKHVLLARHAQHVVLVHFPIALFLTGVAFDCVAQWTNRATLAAAAYYNLLVAAASTLPVVATGVMAWRWQLDGARLKGTLLLHLLLGLISGFLIWIAWWFHFRARRRIDGHPTTLRSPVELAGAVCVTLTGHLGGFLSGVNG